MDTIPIVFSTNDDFALYCYIAIYSLLIHTNNINCYDIRVFVTGVSRENCEMIESLSCDGVSVTCVDISSYLSNVRLENSIHLSVETYYRLFIPLVLPEYIKVLYLDSDMIILADIKELFDYDIEDYPVGVAKDVVCEQLDIHSREIGNLDCRKAFNAGVLLINTRRFEEEHIREKCLALLQEDYDREERIMRFADQDALNVILYEKVRWIDAKWNCQAMYSWRVEDVYEEHRDEYVSNLKQAYIIHYSGDKKPWEYPDLPMSDIFWNVAKTSPVFHNLLCKTIEKEKRKSSKIDCFDHFRFPYDNIPYKSRVAIYGAGAVGTAFYNQLTLSQYAKVVLWVDKNPENCNKEFDIQDIERLRDSDYDYIIIAVFSHRSAEEIRDNLIQMGVLSQKLVWKNY